MKFKGRGIRTLMGYYRCVQWLLKYDLVLDTISVFRYSDCISTKCISNETQIVLNCSKAVQVSFQIDVDKALIKPEALGDDHSG